MDTKPFEAALQRSAKTWKTYILGICVLLLTFLIDYVSGGQFFIGGEPIELATFKVKRDALSATYGIVFMVFVLTTYFESRLLKNLASLTDFSSFDKHSALDLWFISPFSASRGFRALFWFLFFWGFVLLGQFSFIHLWPHLTPFKAPNEKSALLVYKTIGAMDLVVLIGCLPFAYLTFKNLVQVRGRLRR